eukprot:129567-Prymnesium_polylepis.1
MSFQNLYFWLRDQHARGESHNLYDHTTKKLLKRYKLPFKNMTVPPAPNNLFKYVKGARRLSAWIAECQSSMEELDRPVIMGLPRCPRASSCSSHRSSWLLHPVQRLRRRSDRQCGIERGRRHGGQRRCGADAWDCSGGLIDESDHAQGGGSTESDDELERELEAALREGERGTEEEAPQSKDEPQQPRGLTLDAVRELLMRD